MLITYHNVLITISQCVMWKLSALILEQPASAFCYNYSSLKENVHVSTSYASFKNSELYFINVMLNVQWLSLSQIFSDFAVSINQVILTMHNWISVDFVFQNSDSVSINVVYHSSHINQNNQKINKKQSKYLISIFIKTFFIFYIIKFYSSVSQLWLKIKKIADWIKYNTIYSKISQNSRTYK